MESEIGGLHIKIKGLNREITEEKLKVKNLLQFKTNFKKIREELWNANNLVAQYKDMNFKLQNEILEHNRGLMSKYKL